MAKKDLSYKYNTCDCGARKLKRSAKCLPCNRKIGNKYGVKPYEIRSVDGKCLVCKFDLLPKQKAFCCHACWFTYKRIAERDCICCGKLFKPKTIKIRYCSNECGNKHKSVMYRKPGSKVQENKVTVNGVKLGSSSKCDYKPCVICNQQRQSLNPNGSKYCGDDCKYKAAWQSRVKRGKYVHQSAQLTCNYCDCTFSVESHGKSRRFCSNKCLQKQQKAIRKKRLRKCSLRDGSVTLPKVYNRFSGVCSCCKIKCSKPTVLSLPSEATIDHITPISKGGTHTWDNVQLLCRECNTAKRDKDWQVFKNGALTN
jgi:hypothetical protein